MASEHKLEAQVLTPEGEVFSGELQMLVTRTAVGEVGILAGHIPMVARLVPAELRLHKSDSEVDTYAQGEGWLEVFANRARVLIAEAEVARLAGRRRAASSASSRPSRALSEAEEGSAAAEQAERERARCEAFIQIAER